MLRVIVTLLAIWVAINLLFVVLVIPPRGSKGPMPLTGRATCRRLV